MKYSNTPRCSLDAIKIGLCRLLGITTRNSQSQSAQNDVVNNIDWFQQIHGSADSVGQYSKWRKLKGPVKRQHCAHGTR